MNAKEFEDAVRELRMRQKRFFRCRKDDPDKEKSKMMMRDQENKLFPYIEEVLAARPSGEAKSEREQFFLLVADMMKKQREWKKQGGGSWAMYIAKDAEKMVDKWLAKWDEQIAEEKRQALEAEKAKQTRLF